MSSCEKCWADSHTIARECSTWDQADIYRDLVKERNCTPEDQAGPEAGYCPKCSRKTIHQHTIECMNDECMNQEPTS